MYPQFSIKMASDLVRTTSLLGLPSEIRTSILEYVLDDNTSRTGLIKDPGGPRRAVIIDHDYSAAAILAPLLACKHLYLDGRIPALKRTHFLVTNLYINIPERLSRLSDKQLNALRSIAFVADSRHFRAMKTWDDYAFGNAALRLDSLTVVLHESSHHYLFDFTADIAKLLRKLQGVRRVVFVRNHAYVKGAFKTWCNRLIGIIMKIDHYERYDVQPPNPERTWWTWSFDDEAEIFCLEALPSKVMVDEETYMQQIKPLVDELMTSIESEEWNPDPRTRNGT
jgi:hypothetical protein